MGGNSMKQPKHILAVLFWTVLLISMLCVPAFAITESEVEAQVAASSKGAVAGNVLIWFLCAVAFLKVSQKIDSFMATLGVNVGRTGGSLMAEAMIAVRAVTMVVGGKGGAGRAGSAAGSSAGKAGDSSGMAGFFKGGLVGMAGRHVTNSAVKTATTQTSAVHTAQSHVQQAAETAAAATQTSSDTHINSEVHGGSSSVHTDGDSVITPPQGGVIVTGGGASPQAVPTGSTLSIGPVPDSAPPQEGVILTGSEAPIPPTPADMTPADGMPVDTTPPQDGIIITEGGTTVHAPQSENTLSGAPIGPSPQENVSRSGSGQHTESHTERAGQSVHTATSSEKVQTNRFHMYGVARPSLGGMVFSHSLVSGGSFANEVIGTVARGEVAGSITGDMAAQSLQSYLGYTGGDKVPPIFSDAEIGRGRISGYVSTPDHPQPIAFGMYHADQYTEPTGAFSKVRSVDGTLWYTQLAQDAVERKPYKAPDDTVAYHERIVKKLPDAPKRKDRI